MSWVDVDVIAKPGRKDPALQAFRTELENQEALAQALGTASQRKLIKDVTSVYDMVTQITSSLGSRPIRRLRIFGHGSPNTVQVGPFLRTGRRLDDLSRKRKIDQADLTQVLQITHTETKTREGRTVKVEYGLLNEPTLRQLAGRFDPRGWVELHSCEITGDDGKELIKALARLWNVEVHASESKQYVGGGLEGPIWVAKPTGKLFPKSSARTGRLLPKVTPAPTGYDPLQRAARRLAGGPTATSLTRPATTYSDLRTRRTFEVDQFGKRVQAGSSRGLARYAMGPTAQSFRTAHNPLRDAMRKLQVGPTATAPMRPGTMYSDLHTRRTFEVDQFGKHVQAGSPHGLARYATGPTTESFRARYDPVREAGRRLGGGATVLSRMRPGTMYSDLRTRRTFEVDQFGKHVQAGSSRGLARYAMGPTTQSFRTAYNPLREAARRLGG